VHQSYFHSNACTALKLPEPDCNTAKVLHLVMTTEHAQLASLILQDVDGPLAFLQDRIGRCMQWQPSEWLEDAQTSELVVRLQSGEVLETKELLRPVFKWCKRGCEQQACIEKVSGPLLVAVLTLYCIASDSDSRVHVL
jgi:hypothetical protein